MHMTLTESGPELDPYTLADLAPLQVVETHIRPHLRTPHHLEEHKLHHGQNRHLHRRRLVQIALRAFLVPHRQVARAQKQQMPMSSVHGRR